MAPLAGGKKVRGLIVIFSPKTQDNCPDRLHQPITLLHLERSFVLESVALKLLSDNLLDVGCIQSGHRT